ncbi:MAG: alanyl-tRNA editing protein [Acidimicrobiia bacterium]
MTEEIAARDAYQQSVQSSVLEVRSDGGVVLDRTVFYPRGGGQPGDSGWLRWADREVEVIDTVRREGAPVHVVRGDAPADGTTLTAEVDWDRRYLLMRTHTALHALSGIIWRDYRAKVTGGNMQPGEARMDFELEGISTDFGREVEAKLNEALTADHQVEIRFLSRLEALRDPDLIRTKVNLIPEAVDPIRVVDIVGLDRQADGGTHVRSTAEVGEVRVTGTESKGKANKRIRISLLPPRPGEGREGGEAAPNLQVAQSAAAAGPPKKDDRSGRAERGREGAVP